MTQTSTRTKTRTLLALFALFGLFPATASAQWGMAMHSQTPWSQRFPMAAPGGIPWTQRSYLTLSPDGSVYVGVSLPYNWSPTLLSPNAVNRSYMGGYGPMWMPSGSYSTGSGYLSGGVIQNNVLAAAQKDLQLAQRNALSAIGPVTADTARDMIRDVGGYENGATPALTLKPTKDDAAALRKALAVNDEAGVASGESLNAILKAIQIAEARGGKGVSAFLAPQLLDDVRFAGPPAADALNLLRQAGRMPFPPAFDTPELRDLRDELEKNFAAVARGLVSGKPNDPARVLALEATLKKIQKVAPPVIRNLSFEDARLSRRFLNQFDNAMTALKGPAANGLLNQTWATDGTNVADLVKHMTRHKLVFGPAPTGHEDSYLALHKALSTYLFVLTQPKK